MFKRLVSRMAEHVAFTVANFVKNHEDLSGVGGRLLNRFVALVCTAVSMRKAR